MVQQALVVVGTGMAGARLVRHFRVSSIPLYESTTMKKSGGVIGSLS